MSEGCLVRRLFLKGCFRAFFYQNFANVLGKTMKNNVVANPCCDLRLLDCQDQWNKIELGLLVMALLVVNLTTMCLANEIHWAHSDSWSSLATFNCAHVHHAMLLNIFQISRKVSATDVLGTCTDFIWFQNSHLNITHHMPIRPRKKSRSR